MRYIAGFALILAFSLGGYAQQKSTNAVTHRFRPQLFPQAPLPYRNYVSPSGFGNILFPGTAGPPPPPTYPVNPPVTFVQSFGNNMLGGGGRGGWGSGGGGWGSRGGGGGIVAYPVILGGGYGGVGYYGGGGCYGGVDYNGNPCPSQQNQQQAPNITIVMPPQQSTPPVTINQYAPEGGEAPSSGAAAPSGGSVQTYQAPSEERPEPDGQVMFFIALKDSSVYTAVAYWVEDGTLHYITPQGKHNQVSIALVDRQTSAKLNAGGKVEFHLPAQR